MYNLLARVYCTNKFLYKTFCQHSRRIYSYTQYTASDTRSNQSNFIFEFSEKKNTYTVPLFEDMSESGGPPPTKKIFLVDNKPCSKSWYYEVQRRRKNEKLRQSSFNPEREKVPTTSLLVLCSTYLL